MDTIQLMQWKQEFDQIMSSGMPEQLQLDNLRELHRRSTEQPDMLDEPAETETERML